MSGEESSEVEALIARGAWSEAARLLEAAGALERAQALYEKTWQFADAARVALSRGDRADALRLALEAKDLPSAARLGEELAGGSEAERRGAATIYERKRMWPEAARLREAAGEAEAALALYRRAGLLLEAARLEEACGRPREAGILLERLLAEAPRSDDTGGAAAEMARAHAALGRIFGASFGRHDEAARHLQRALRLPGDPALLDEARRQLVEELAALGFDSGARQLLDDLRARDPRLPQLDAFLKRRARGSARDGDALLGGRYQVQRLLGSGGMGRVYLARDRFTARDVAVKVVAPPLDARARDGWLRFVREARVVSLLKHPNLVAVHEFHEEIGLLVMEHMAGGTLADRLGGELSPSRIRTILVELIQGLAAAHARGVIHRDLKPANVFFSATSVTKLGDFGVAHLQDLGATQTGGFIGTLAYMSPEQITGARLTFGCDVYALGVTAFQLLTGRLPFGGPDFVGQHLGAAPPRVSSLRPELRGWDELVLRMLAKDPAERCASLDELARAIGAIELPDPAPRAAPATAPAPTPAGDPDDGERYRLEDEVARSPRSIVRRAVDVRLGRAVLVEDLEPAHLATDEGAAHLRWLRVMARHGGPHLQRVLRLEIEGARARVVFEAASGPPPGWVDRAGAARLLERVCRALAGPHGDGVAHGDLARALLLEEAGPLVQLAGFAPTGAQPGDDLAAAVALLARLGGPQVVEGAPLSSVGALAGWARAVIG